MASVSASIGTISLPFNAQGTASLTDVPAPVVPGGLYPMRTKVYSVPDYRVSNGWPVPIPKYDFTAVADFSLDSSKIGTRPAPASVVTGAVDRWVGSGFDGVATPNWPATVGSTTFTSNATFKPVKIDVNYLVGNEYFSRKAVQFSADSKSHLWANISDLGLGDLPDVADGEYTLIMVMQTQAQVTNATPFAGIWYPGSATPTSGTTFSESVSGQHNDVALIGHYIGVGSNITSVPAGAKTNLVANPSFEVTAAGWSGSPGAAIDRTNEVTAQFGSWEGRYFQSNQVINNLISNPSFETSINGWSAGSLTTGVVRDTAQHVVGSAAIRGTALPQGNVGTWNYYLNSPDVVVSAGKQYTASFYIKWAPSNASVLSAKYGYIMRWYNSSGSQIGADITYTGGTMTSGTWYRVANTMTSPAGAAHFRIFPRITMSSNAFSQLVSANYWVDAVMMNDGVLLGYFDGNTTDDATYQYDWTGTANLSTSTRTSKTTSATYVATQNISVSHGLPYTFSAYVRNGATARTMKLSIQWLTSTGTPISAPSTTVSPGTAWTRQSVTDTAPDTASFAQLRIGIDAAIAIGEKHYVDGVMFEQSASLNTYFEGSTSTAEIPAPPSVMSIHNELQASKPFYIAFVFSRPTGRVYVGGGPSQLRSTSYYSGAATGSNATGIVLGRSTGSTLHTIDMALLDLGIYTGALSTDQVKKEIALLSQSYGGK